MTAAIEKDIETRILETAREAALEAGEVLASGYDRPKKIRYKGDIDLVTEFDLASEKIIVDKIRNAFPDHAILARRRRRQGLFVRRFMVYRPVGRYDQFCPWFSGVLCFDRL